jgi:TM2 domain-containing membrane protein YozV
VQHGPLRPWLAATLSLFCGLGQLYNGQVVKGIVLLVLGAAALLSLQLSLGKIMVPLLWMYAIVDAYMVARRTGP